MTHRVVFDFKVTRRVGWDISGLNGLTDHLEAVRRAAEASPIASRAEIDANLEAATLQLAVWVDASSATDAEALATLEVAEAIRSAGASHVGLLSSAEEARVSAGHSTWSGLRTPSWHPRGLAVVEPELPTTSDIRTTASVF